MKKTIMPLLLIIIILSGCNNTNFVELHGDSENWKGKYSANISNNSEDAKYFFSYKTGDKETTFKELEIDINDGMLSISDDNHKGATIEIPTSCRNCYSSEKESIKVKIKWDKEKEETIYLK